MVALANSTKMCYTYDNLYYDNGLIYMRARYYSPDMRRFVNADIVAGGISNAITLNRFAYANGNPVSLVDPLGLWSLKGAWNSFTNWVSDKANDIKDWAVETYNSAKDAVVEAGEKTIEWVQNDGVDFLKRQVLKMESVLNNGYANSLFLPKPMIFTGLFLTIGHDHINYHYNKNQEKTNEYIGDQDTVSFKLGLSDFAWSGCEAVAVYNAMYATGYNPSVSNVVLKFQQNGAVILNHLASGAFGGNPYSIPKVLNSMNVNYKTASLDEMTENAAYILSYWNYPNSINPSIHTITIVKTNNGYITYNYRNNPEFNSIDEIEKEFGDGFITGHQITNRK